ncbi:PAS domain S-box protein [Lichenicoccus roseus]|uniref:histidine kinase n=1 Tax=Lichenicoccus roseus TaxID=2683649 RepID=A0A5R9J255_9PROT|nr:PAS domain S-box protein [Lichenicoccus roseus]
MAAWVRSACGRCCSPGARGDAQAKRSRCRPRPIGSEAGMADHDSNATGPAFDWSSTTLGAVEGWPPGVATVLAALLDSRLPGLLAVGPDLVCLPNDACAALLGDARETIGMPLRSLWPGALDSFDAAIRQALDGAGVVAPVALRVRRGGVLREAWFDCGFSPIRDPDGRVRAILVQGNETTVQVLAGRRQAFRASLAATLQGETEPHRIIMAGAGLLGRRIGAERVGYVEFDPAGHARDHGWCAPDVPELAGGVLDGPIGPALTAALQANRLSAIADLAQDPTARAATPADTSAKPAVRAAIVVPMVTGGETAALIVHQGTPRQWTREEEDCAAIAAAEIHHEIARSGVQARMQEGEANWRALFNRLQEGFIIGELMRDRAGQAVDWRYVDVNPAWERLIGMSRTAAVGRTIREILPGIEAEWVSRFAQVVETGQATTFSDRVASSGRWYEGHAFVLGGERFAVLFLEITARRRDEERKLALLDLGDRLRGLREPELIAEAAATAIGVALGTAQAAYAVIHPDGDSASVLRPWRRDEGVVSVEGAQRLSQSGRFADRLHAGDAVVVDDVETTGLSINRRGLVEQAGIRAFVNLPLLEGGRLAGLILASDDRPRAWTVEDLAFMRSVADRTWAALQTAAAEAGLLALNLDLERQVEARTIERDRVWKNSQDLLCVLERGLVQSANPAWTTLLGWLPGELLGRQYQTLCHPDDFAPATARVGQEAAGRLPRTETRMRHRDGSWHWFAWVGTVEDELVYASGRDIAAERAAAEALARADERLRQSQKMEAVGQLTGGIAHDFNNMLQGIGSGVELMRRRLDDGRADLAARYLDAIAQSVERAAALTNRLLAFSRRQALAPARVNLDGLLPGTAELIRQTVGPAIAVETSLRDGSWPVRCDPNQMENALLNLAINARDAMLPDGGRLLIETAHVVLDRHDLTGWDDAQPGDFVRVTVTDTGTGMTPDVLEHAFEPFYTTKAAGQGTGLGLSQVFGFVSQSHGVVRLQTEQGRGTAVQLFLPRDTGIHEDEVRSAPPPASGDGLRARTVLLGRGRIACSSHDSRGAARPWLPGPGGRRRSQGVGPAQAGFRRRLAADRHAGGRYRAAGRPQRAAACGCGTRAAAGPAGAADHRLCRQRTGRPGRPRRRDAPARQAFHARCA